SATRVAYRHFREVRTLKRARDVVPTLILGRAADVEVPLRAIESGAMAKFWPVGLLSPARSDRRVTGRSAPVLGGFADLGRAVAPERNPGRAVGSDNVRVRSGQRRGFDLDAGASPRSHHQPDAVA